MIVINLINELNSKNINDAIEIMDIITEDVFVSQHLDIWDVAVINRNGQIETARIELNNQGSFILENFIHGVMELNSFFIPPNQSMANNDLAMIVVEAKITSSKNHN